MKKLVSLVLALVMIMGLATTAFAETLNAEDKIGTGVVKGVYAEAITEAEVVSVDITWGAMEFTYTVSGTDNWNPADHSYANPRTGAWSADGNTVKVTNHSNVGVTVEFAFAAKEGFDVTGSFGDNAEATLTRGVEGEYDEAPSVTATLTMGGALESTVKTLTEIGTITVTIDVVTAE